MLLQALCERLTLELNETHGWHLPAEACADLAQAVLPFVDADTPSDGIRNVIFNYYLDGPRLERMKLRGDPEGDADWEATREYFVRQAYRVGVPYPDAEDVAQDACRKAMTRLSSFGFRSRLEAWLSVLIRNESWQWFRSNKRKSLDVSFDAIDSIGEGRIVQQGLAEEHQRTDMSQATNPGSTTPESETLRAERRGVLHQAIEQLVSGKYLQILYYSYVETDRVLSDGRLVKWTDEEIAKEIGLAPSSVAKTRDRILTRLRDDAAFRTLIEDLFGMDWLTDRKPARKGRVRTRQVHASYKINEKKDPP